MYERGIAELTALGVRVRPAPLVDVEKAWWWAAARPHEVANELNDLFRDPEIRAIWALVGGRLTLSYLDAIDYYAIAATIQVMPDAPQSLRDVVLDVLGDRDIPVIANVNLGHAGPNVPLPIGSRAAIDADALTIALVEAAVT